ncbi:hypothetical protein DRO69_01400 [Candidatus Bathyarchaeota archaeon]|nr:MAG: hypothetical protein DRO69_01400 [Candidatus Bathyarchaeota archaeon]
MNAKAFAVGVILVFLGWYVNTISIPMPGVDYWSPSSGVTIPYPTIVWGNPLGFLSLPLVLIGAILIAFGLFENTAIRIVLTILIVVWVLVFKAAPILGVIP